MIRKIETQTDRQTKQRRLNIILGIIIVALMIFSTLGYAILGNGSSESEKKYGNYKFIQTATGWQVTLKDFNNKNLITNYLPGEVLNYTGTGADTYYYSGRTVYVVVASQQEAQSTSEILVNINDLVSRIQFACSYDNENSSFCQESNLPLKDCSDSGSDTTIIKVDSNSTKSSYSYEGGCLILKGQGSDFIKMSDNFLFRMFKVIQ
jgi:uncharacterized protein YpmB